MKRIERDKKENDGNKYISLMHYLKTKMHV